MYLLSVHKNINKEKDYVVGYAIRLWYTLLRNNDRFREQKLVEVKTPCLSNLL